MPDVDEQLREFLRWKQAERREGHTLTNLHLELMAVKGALEVFSANQHTQNARIADLENDREFVHDTLTAHGASIVKMKRRLRTGPADEEMDTGQFDLRAIEREVEAQRKRESMRVRAETENVVWWRRTFVGWVAAGLAFIAVSIINLLVANALIANAAKAPAPAPPPQEVRK